MKKDSPLRLNNSMIKIHSYTNKHITFLIDGKKVVYCRLKEKLSRKERDYKNSKK